MANQEILVQAIKKAIANGWEEPNGNTLQVDEKGRLFAFLKDSEVRAYGFQVNIEKLIFNHDFAKALWGETWRDLHGAINSRQGWGSKQTLEQVDGQPFLYAWQYHLQQMVISEDPIKYLGEHLDG